MSLYTFSFSWKSFYEIFKSGSFSVTSPVTPINHAATWIAVKWWLTAARCSFILIKTDPIFVCALDLARTPDKGKCMSRPRLWQWGSRSGSPERSVVNGRCWPVSGCTRRVGPAPVWRRDGVGRRRPDVKPAPGRRPPRLTALRDLGSACRRHARRDLFQVFAG